MPRMARVIVSNCPHHIVQRGQLERRTCSLGEGRYKISPIETGAYLMACCRYVELNPVKANIVALPEDYRWSSYRLKLAGDWGWLDCDPCFAALAPNPTGCIESYKQFVKAAVPDDVESLIRQAI